MKIKYIKLFLSLIFSLTFARPTFAQLDSIFDQGVYRTFIVHTPTGYNPSNRYPLVINLHGLNSNAAQQAGYSQFDKVADTEKFIVVYPNAIDQSWKLNGNADVDFIAHLIDTIRQRYACNACLFSTGMSMGGFLTYKLACGLPQPLTAIAVVSGNMTQQLQNTCVPGKGLPVMHFHGTTDPLVNYNGTVGIPPVETTIQWWVDKNKCNTTPFVTALPNTNTTDNCTVERYYYGGGLQGSDMTFYKITNGGHTWPGPIPVPPFGNTNQDILASNLIGAFFKQFCAPLVETKELDGPIGLSVYPNPFTDHLYLQGALGCEMFVLTNALGQPVYAGNNISSQDFSALPVGSYFLKAIGAKSKAGQVVKVVKQ